MKIPSGGFLANSGEGEKKAINSELWHTCAGPLVSLPPVGSLVVYFPQGHSEQVAASIMQKEADGIPSYPNLPSKLICMLHNVTLHADGETDEVYAQMTLQPVNKYDQEALLVSDIGLKHNRQPTEFFCKTLTASDTSTHGGFSVPRRAAEKIFPPLDFSMQPPAQELTARDLHDQTWTFRHIYRGQPKRYLLTTGWSVFVSSKRLIAGDAVLFIRDEKSQLLLGIRRANRQQPALSSSVISSDSMHIGVLAAAAHAAANYSPFTIFYNPRASPSEFVIPLAKYNKAMYTQVSSGMRFRMMFETEESGMRRYMGTVTSISDLDPVRWKNSQWRNLQVGWDESTAGERPARVSIWEIEPVVTPFYICPPPFFRPKFPKHPGFPDDDSDIENMFKHGMPWLAAADDFGSKDASSSMFPGLSLAQWMNMQQQQNNQLSASNHLPNTASSTPNMQNNLDNSKLLSFQSPAGLATPPNLHPTKLNNNHQNQQASQLVQPNAPSWPQQQQQQQQQQQPTLFPPAINGTISDHRNLQQTAATYSQQNDISTNRSVFPAATTISQDFPFQQNVEHLLERPHELQLPQSLSPHRPVITQQSLSLEQQMLLQKLHQQQQLQQQLSSGPLNNPLQQPLQQQMSNGPLNNPLQQQCPVNQFQHKTSPLVAMANSGRKDVDAPPLCSTSPSTTKLQTNFFQNQTPTSLLDNTIVHPPTNSRHEMSNNPKGVGVVREQHKYKSVGNEHMDAMSSATSYCLDAGGGGGVHQNFAMTGLDSGDVQSHAVGNNGLPFAVAGIDGLPPDAQLSRGYDSGKDIQNLLSNYSGTPRDIEPDLSSSMNSQSFGVPDMSFKPGCSNDAPAAINETGIPNGGLWPNQTQRMRTYTKVQKRGSVGRTIDVTRYKGYDELRHDLARMFGIEGLLEDPQRTEWKLVYVDHEKDILLVGDDPWEEFVSCVQSIKILSSAEVQQMSLDGDLGGQLPPAPKQACSVSDSGNNAWRVHYDDNSATSSTAKVFRQ